MELYILHVYLKLPVYVFNCTAIFFLMNIGITVIDIDNELVFPRMIPICIFELRITCILHKTNQEARILNI